MRADKLEKNSGQYGAGPGAIRVLPDSAAVDLLASDSGKVIVVPDLTASMTIDLPSEALGLVYEFIYAGAASDAQNFILDSEANANYFIGGVLWADDDAGSGGDEVQPVYSNGSSNSIFTVVTPDAGTWVKIWCDGTHWYITGTVAASATPTFADQA